MSLKQLIKETLGNHLNKSLILKENVEVSDALQYHIENDMSLTNNVFRVYSEGYFNLVNEVRDLYNEGKIDLNYKDKLMVESDLHKKFAVYTKSKTGGLKKVTFGESKLVIKESSNCLQKTDRTTAGYWSCNIGKYSKQLGLSSSNS
jgi:hypothetical protein